MGGVGLGNAVGAWAKTKLYSASFIYLSTIVSGINSDEKTSKKQELFKSPSALDPSKHHQPNWTSQTQVIVERKYEGSAACAKAPYLE